MSHAPFEPTHLTTGAPIKKSTRQEEVKSSQHVEKMSCPHDDPQAWAQGLPPRTPMQREFEAAYGNEILSRDEFALSRAHVTGGYTFRNTAERFQLFATKNTSAVVMDDERAAFEAWWVREVPERYRADTLRVLKQSRELDGAYGIGKSQAAWEGWQARATSPQPVARTERVLTDEQIAALRVATDALIERYAAPIREILANAAQPANGDGA